MAPIRALIQRQSGSSCPFVFTYFCVLTVITFPRYVNMFSIVAMIRLHKRGSHPLASRTALNIPSETTYTPITIREIIPPALEDPDYTMPSKTWRTWFAEGPGRIKFSLSARAGIRVTSATRVRSRELDRL